MHLALLDLWLMFRGPWSARLETSGPYAILYYSNGAMQMQIFGDQDFDLILPKPNRICSNVVQIFPNFAQFCQKNKIS